MGRHLDGVVGGFGAVIEAVEGSPSLTQCVSELGTCQQFDTCNVKSPLQRLNDRVLRMLSEATLASMVEEDFRDWTDSVDPAPTSPVDETKEVRLPVVQR